MTGEPRAIRAIVAGTVQGVGFRDATQRKARSLGVMGWVRNGDDATVQVHAEGPQDALDHLLAFLHEGPREARVGEVSAALRAGRHTTSETTLYGLGPDSWIIDSPGMKEFGLAHLATAEIAQGFVDLRPFVGHCRFRDCRHGAEPGCAVQDAVARGEVKPWRVALLQRLLGESETRARSWSR